MYFLYFLPGSESLQRVGRGALCPPAQSVKDAQVIVVATPLDSAPAPPRRPGDLPEFTIRFRVVRVLKGQPADMVIMTRTLTAPDEFLGKDWILLLSPDFVAGKHSYAECLTIKAELEVKAILAQGLK